MKKTFNFLTELGRYNTIQYTIHYIKAENCPEIAKYSHEMTKSSGS